eukprot:CAMPEP_0194598462 /NCGR_PEP_ID=MMETSP0292-20121207/27020_1 /TAXON_ID=39354 /ORGANISM="Heterosigma akashiwo, Strain CCMP2393" /LENGTH=62 /DNA_ID=CAMNT_0039459421 /DNA_START=375 /DNA_END=560 /DNA_ORIENTATION=-
MMKHFGDPNTELKLTTPVSGQSEFEQANPSNWPIQFSNIYTALCQGIFDFNFDFIGDARESF